MSGWSQGNSARRQPSSIAVSGITDPGDSSPRCAGSAPAGYVVGFTDCNDANLSARPGAAETCNGIDDDCNGFIAESASGVDSDADTIHDACDLKVLKATGEYTQTPGSNALADRAPTSEREPLPVELR